MIIRSRMIPAAHYVFWVYSTTPFFPSRQIIVLIIVSSHLTVGFITQS